MDVPLPSGKLSPTSFPGEIAACEKNVATAIETSPMIQVLLRYNKTEAVIKLLHGL